MEFKVNYFSNLQLRPKSLYQKNDLDIVLQKTKNSWSIISDNNEKTKSSQTQSLNELKIINYEKRTFNINTEKTPGTTKSSGDKYSIQDTVSVYLVDFENNGVKGFAIASDDYRFPHAIAISEKGSLADTVFNTGLTMYLNSLNEVCKEQIVKYNETANVPDNSLKWSSIYSPIKPEILIKLNYKTYGDDTMNDVETEVTEGYVTKDVNPLLRTQWSQGAPYNNKCNGGGAPAGCVPIATAQIMAYFKKPCTASYWDELTQYSFVSTGNAVLADRVSTLLYDVGKGVGVKYASGGSGADFKDAAPYLRSVGINCTFIDDFHADLLLNQLNASKPVMLAGKKTKGFLGLYYKDGHAWIIDGHFSFKYHLVVKVTQYYLDDFGGWREYNYYETYNWNNATYYHINWGWGGYSDGYYTSVNYSNKTNDHYQYDSRMIVF